MYKLVFYYFPGSLPEVLVYDILPSPVTSITLLKEETGAAPSKSGSWLISAVQRRLTDILCHDT